MGVDAERGDVVRVAPAADSTVSKWPAHRTVALLPGSLPQGGVVPDTPIHALLSAPAALALQTVSGSFALGIQLAAPVIVFSLVFNLATGLIGRVMPAFQIFFVASPLSVLLGLSIFALSLGGIGVVWADRYRDLLANFG